MENQPYIVPSFRFGLRTCETLTFSDVASIIKAVERFCSFTVSFLNNKISPLFLQQLVHYFVKVPPWFGEHFTMHCVVASSVSQHYRIHYAPHNAGQC